MLEARKAITEDGIHELVHTFYARVREDDLLAPVFEARLSERWPEHLDRMVDFWSSVLLASRRFRGNPRERHHAIDEMRPEHFDRWLELFEEVLLEVFPPHAAQDVLWRARRMRLVLERPEPSDATHENTVLSTTRMTR